MIKKNKIILYLIFFFTSVVLFVASHLLGSEGHPSRWPFNASMATFMLSIFMIPAIKKDESTRKADKHGRLG